MDHLFYPEKDPRSKRNNWDRSLKVVTKTSRCRVMRDNAGRRCAIIVQTTRINNIPRDLNKDRAA